MRKYFVSRFIRNKKRCFIYKLLILCFFSMPVSAGNNLLYDEIFTSEQSTDVIVIKGHVTDGEGKALRGVTVLLIERARKVVTDSNGDYIISVYPKENLEFSFAGFKNKTVKVSDEIINVTLRRCLK
ncbi:carboxypeptidase-like regulatory domain-containing protein [Flavobacterium plurextorum]|nr:carboxypeptidase-like regulatory domain-containing protein [Flavobacterium plurextorum]